MKSNDYYYLFSCTDDTNDSTVSCSIDKDGSYNGILYTKKETNEKEYTYEKVRNTRDLSSINLTKDELYTYDCYKGECKPTEALIRYGSTTTVDTAYCGVGSACTSKIQTISITNIGNFSYKTNDETGDSGFVMTDSDSNDKFIGMGNCGFSGSDSLFTILKNVDNNILGIAKYYGKIIFFCFIIYKNELLIYYLY